MIIIPAGCENENERRESIVSKVRRTIDMVVLLEARLDGRDGVHDQHPSQEKAHTMVVNSTS